MLGKLFKYEMKSTARTFLPFLAAILVLSVINRIMMALFSNNPYLEIPRALLMTTYVLFIIAAFVLCVIVTIQRFYKNLLGQEGYLMFTLPVSTSANILSKGFAALIWMLATVVTTLVSVLIILPDSSWLGQIPRLLADAQREFDELGANLNLGLLIGLLIGLLLVAFIAFIMQVYTSISLGQLSNNHKLLTSFGAYVGIYLALQILMMVGLLLLSGGFLDQLDQWNNTVSITANMQFPQFFGQFMYSMLGLAIGMDIVLNVIYFFVTRWLLGKKLNLE